MKNSKQPYGGVGGIALWMICLGVVPAYGTCPSTPDTSCKFSHAASFAYANSDSDKRDKLAFKFSKGASSAVADFGSPTTTDSYDLCIYTNGALASGMAVAADGDCSDGPCWVSKAKGFAFKDKTGTPDGITGITLATSLDPGDDKTKIGVTGKGANLPDMAVPLSEPIAVQLMNSLGNCWGAVFAGPEQVEQDASKGKVKLSGKTEEFPSCFDSVKNGWESDQDCGGSCDLCGYTKSCNGDSDCISGSCVSGSCAAGCNDGVQNGDESARDCGGSCSTKCTFGRTCNSNSDCDTNICRSGKCSAKLVFVTSTSYAGNFGGLAAADTGCNDRAAAAGLGGSWTAWLSTSSTNAIDRIVDQRYVGVDGFVAFENKAQITGTAKPTWGISRTELDGDAGPYQAWTGTNNTGTSISPNCLNWTTNSNLYQGWLGWPGTPISWSAYGPVDCNNVRHLICFEN